MTALPPHADASLAVDPLIAANVEDFVAIRHDLHRHPELSFKEHRTSELVAGFLRRWGFDVTTGIAGTGVIGTLRRGTGPRSIALRADMDALPIGERTGLPFASAVDGVMHACGHDGHTTILLAAARRLAESGRFDGTLHVVFQPAEEIGGGAKRLIAEGLFDRFPADAIFGLHNWPGLPTGRFGFVTGPAMASVDQAIVTVRGRGGHGAAPHEAVDPVLAAAHIVTALQSVVSRNVDPLDTGVVTVGAIHGGMASNVIPDVVELRITIRSFRPEVRALLERRISALAKAQAESFGALAEIDYRRGYPPVVNHAAETELASRIAVDAFGAGAILPDLPPRTASEDFAFFLEKVPGAFLFVGNGDGAPLHSPEYRFNDDIIAPAATYWVRLAERYLA